MAYHDTTTSWTARTVAITGAGGFFGSHLANLLLNAGASVRALVRYNSQGSVGCLSGLRSRDGLEIRFGDIKSPATILPLVEGCDTVFHLAALISVPHSYNDPVGYEQTNVLGTLHVLDSCRAAAVRRVIVVSSSEVYGTVLEGTISESHPLVGQSPYAATKIAAEKLSQSYFRSFDLPVVIVRPFNLYGPRQSRRAVIPEIIAQALASDVIRLGNVETYRDFNFVEDTCEAVSRIGITPGIDGAVYNIGSGIPVQIKDIVGLIAEILGRDLATETDPARMRPEGSEVRRLCADSSAAVRVIGQWPTTPLRAGLSRVIEDLRPSQGNPQPDFR